MVDWLRRARAAARGRDRAARSDDVEDFLRVEDFAYGVEQVFSTDRWCLVGEAGAFADPFYSPGSDFIGYGNTFTTDLITRDLDGEDIAERLEYYNDFYQRTFDYVLSKYEDQYPVFGHPAVMVPKLHWDAFIQPLRARCCSRSRTGSRTSSSCGAVDEDLERLYRLSMNMQKLFREWHELEQRDEADPGGIGVWPLHAGDAMR